MSTTTIRHNTPVEKRALARPVRLAIVIVMGIVIPTCGPKVESDRTSGKGGDAVKGTAIKTSAILIAAKNADSAAGLKGIRYSISCPSKTAGKRGQTFEIRELTVDLLTSFRSATEDYDSCVVDISSLHIETDDETCDLDPAGGIRTIDLPASGDGASPARTLAAIHSCVSRSSPSQRVRRVFAVGKDFPAIALSAAQKLDVVDVQFAEVAPPAPTPTPATTSPTIPVPLVGIDGFPLVASSAPVGAQNDSGAVTSASAELACVDLAATGLAIPASMQQTSDFEIQKKNPWCTSAALRHVFAAVVNCSNLNAPSRTNIPLNQLSSLDVLMTLRFRHVADPVTGAAPFEPAGPEARKFTVDNLPFSGNASGKTCVVVAVPARAPDASTEVPSAPNRDKFSFSTFTFNEEQPDPSTCLSGINAFTTTGGKLWSQVDFDSATRLGAVAPDNGDDGTPLAFSASILRDAAAGNTTRTHVADAAVVSAYEGACARRSLQLLAPATGSTVNSSPLTYGLAIELADTAKTEIARRFRGDAAPAELEGLTFGLMSVRDPASPNNAATPATENTAAKLPVLGFGNLTGSEADRRANGIYWQKKTYDNGNKRWAICLTLHGRDDVCASRTFANDGNLATINAQKTFIAVAMARLPASHDASGKVFINLFINGQTAFFDGSDNRTSLDLRADEARQILSGLGTFVIGANLQKTAHADATYNAWFLLDRPVNAAEIRTVAQSIDGSIIPASGEAGATALNQIRISVTTKGGSVSGGGIATTEPESTSTAAVIPGSPLNLTANARPGYAFKSWGGDCAGSAPTCNIQEIRSDKTIMATFEARTAKINLVSETGGSIGLDVNGVGGLFCAGNCGERSFTTGDRVILTATPSPGYAFAGWDDSAGALCAGTQTPACAVNFDPATWDFNNTTVRAAKARFTPSTYSLSVAMTPAVLATPPDTLGTIKINGTTATDAQVTHGVATTVQAVASAPRFRFKQWNAGGPCSGQGASCTLTPTGPINLVAEFERNTVMVSISVVGRGIVATSGPVAGAVNCRSESTATCSAEVPYGGSLSLTATPADHAVFGEWTPSTCGSNSSCTIEGVGTNVAAPSFTARFDVEQVQVSVNPRPDHGTVSSEDNRINCGPGAATCAASYDYNASSNIILTATAATGYRFTGWTGCTSSLPLAANSCRVPLTSAATAAASFEKLLKLSVAVTDSLPADKSVKATYATTSRTISGGQTAVMADDLPPGAPKTVVISDVPAGFNCAIAGAGGVMGAADETATVSCTPINYFVASTASPTSGATFATGAVASWQYGDTATVSPVVSPHYRLKPTGRWTVSPTSARTDLCSDSTTTCKFTITENTAVTANLELVPYNLTLGAIPAGKATLTASNPGPYTSGTQVSITPSVETGFALKNTGRWLVDPSTAASDCGDASSVCKVTINGDTTVTVNIEAVYKLTANVSGLPNRVSAVSIAASTSGTGAPGAIDKTLFNGTGQELAGGFRTGNAFSALRVTGKPENYTCDVSPVSGTFAAADINVDVTCREDKPTISFISDTFSFTRSTVITPVVPVLGGGSVASCTVAPALPAGLAIAASNCVISGTPTALAPASDYRITAANGTGSSSATVNITVVDVAPAISLQTTTFSFTKNTAIASITPVLSGGAATGCAIAPALPAGLTINNTTCVISGTPTEIRAQTSHAITVRNTGGSNTVSISITVNDIRPQISFTPASYKGPRGTSIGNITPTLGGGQVTGCDITPALPAGLSISPSTCAISGTPTAMSPQTAYTVTASNSGGNATASFSLWITDIPPVLTLSPTAYTFAVNSAIAGIVPTRTGGTVTDCSVTPALPAGLEVVVMSSNCRIRGTPTAVSPATTYTLTGSNDGGSAQVAVQVTVNDIAPQIAYSPSVLTLTKGTAMPAITRTTSGGAIVSCSVSPALPAGLTLNTSNCTVSGTPTALQAQTVHTITATNTGGSGSTTLTITVNDVAPQISYSSTTIGMTVNTPMPAVTLSSTGGAIVSCAITPALPAGLSLNTSTCAITGTPNALQVQTNHTVTATNSGGTGTAALTITVNDVPPAISFASSYTLTRTVSATITPNLSGGAVVSCALAPTPPSTTIPALPAGLSLNASTCVVSGTPTALMTTATSYTVVATNSGGSRSAILNLVVNDLAPTFEFPSNYAVFTRGTPITPITPTTGGGAITSCESIPALPAGLSINNTTCAISGTPSAPAASSAYQIYARNSGGYALILLTILVNDIAPQISYTPSSMILTKNVAMPAVTRNSTGGNIASCSVSPALPAGIALNTSTCAVSGTPTALQGMTNYTVTAINSAGSGTATLTITVNDEPPALIGYTPSAIVLTKNGSLPSLAIGRSGGAIVSCSANPALPAGLTLNQSTCGLIGSPTAIQAQTPHTITATNSGGSGSTTLTITVNDTPPTIGYANTDYTFTVNSAITPITPTIGGGSITSCTSNPALPAGLAINNMTCVITGTPTVASARTGYYITASNSQYSAGVGPLYITVLQPLTLTASAPTLVRGGTLKVTAAGGDPALPVTYSITSTNPGLSIDNTGLIRWTQSGGSTIAQVTAAATKSSSQSASVTFTVNHNFADVTTDSTNEPSNCTATPGRCAYRMDSNGLAYAKQPSSASCADLNTANYNGYNDWRSPTTTELQAASNVQISTLLGTSTALCVRDSSLFKWSAYNFSVVPTSYPSGCSGTRYIAYNYEYNLWAGVITCSPDMTKYKIYLSSTKTGSYYPVGDGAGSGQDHCELVNPRVNTEDCSADGCAYGAYSGGNGVDQAFLRVVVGQIPSLSTAPGAYNSMQWYQCRQSIPDNLVSLTTQNAGTGSGSVTRSPDLTSYPFGQSVTLTATASGDSAFAGWSGDAASCGTTATCTITMAGNKQVTASFLTRYQVTLTQPPAGAGTASASVTNPGTPITYCTGASLSAVPSGCLVTLTMSGIPAGYTAYWGGGGPCTGTAASCSFLVSGSSSVRLYSGRQCGNPGNDCYTLAANYPTITSAVLPNAGGEGQVDYVTTTSGFKIWKENGGSGRILNATGLWYSASDWQQTLTRRGHQYSGSYLTSATHIGTIAGRACPTHVFKSGNFTMTSQCLYYDTATSIASMNQATGVEGDDYLTYWNTNPTGNGAGASWYEGNIKVCADKGMRLPTLYETQANQPSYWTPSDAFPTFGGTRVPSSPSAWTVTATANSYNTIGYWSWLGSNNGNGYRAYNIASDVRCVLP